MTSDQHEFLKARRFLLDHLDNYEKAYRDFRWPELKKFNWAIHWFDHYAVDNQRTALWLVGADGTQEKRTFLELSQKSARVAVFLQRLGIKPGERILVMLPNCISLWEVMLGAMKMGAVVVPTSTLASAHDLNDRITRGEIKLVLTDLEGAKKFDSIPGNFLRCVVGTHPGWINFLESKRESLEFKPNPHHTVDAPLLLYFTSGTTAKPKLVLHTHRSYPVGHLSTMYWIGVREGDTHQNISSPGWAKHAWSSLFAPWNAGATLFVHEARFQPSSTKHWLEKAQVNSLCAPPTVWRMMILDQLGPKPSALRELVSAGEPLNAEVIEQVHTAWGITIRDGFGQTETTAQVGNTVGQPVKAGSMGRPLPGYSVTLLDSSNNEGTEGEIALRIKDRPAGLMVGYLDDPERSKAVMAGGYYRTGDEATVDSDGYFHFVGRGDDVFKSSDYRISPFELESVLIEHEWVAEAAVVPMPDKVKLCVPKAFVVLKPDIPADEATAKNILHTTNAKLAPYKKIREIEFGPLPKTISGKIRRVELRKKEEATSTKADRIFFRYTS